MNTPDTSPLLDFGAWQGANGQASAWAHHIEYLRDAGYGRPFGPLPAVDGLPAELVGFVVSRGWADALLIGAPLPGLSLFTAPRAAVPPPSPFAVVSLVYFDRPVELFYCPPRPATPAGNLWAPLTPEKLLRGVALALPFWPGLFGITRPAESLAAMRQLLDRADEAAPDAPRPGCPAEPCGPRRAEWADLAVQYALFGQRHGGGGFF